MGHVLEYMHMWTDPTGRPDSTYSMPLIPHPHPHHPSSSLPAPPSSSTYLPIIAHIPPSTPSYTWYWSLHGDAIPSPYHPPHKSAVQFSDCNIRTLVLAFPPPLHYLNVSHAPLRSSAAQCKAAKANTARDKTHGIDSKGPSRQQSPA